MLEKRLINHLQGLVAPSKLLALLKFDNEIAQGEFFSQGFQFFIDEEKTGLRTYSNDSLFLSSIIEFANADGTGSTYGFWLRNGNLDLDNAPIVAFGSEGGFHIVAKNIDELLQLLTFDCEPMISWDNVYFYKDLDDFNPSNKSSEYVDWIRNEFSLYPVTDTTQIIEDAQEFFKLDFDNWVRKFYTN